MSTYIVRLSDNHELVGFFAANSYEDLADVVDECCDPNSCEAMTITRGGIFWTKNDGVPAIPDRTQFTQFTSEATISEYTCHDTERKKWKSLNGLYRHQAATR